MGKPFRLTETFAYVPASTATDQPLYSAVDVGTFDVLDVMVTATFDTTNGVMPVALLSGFQCVSTPGWVTIAVATLTYSNPAIAIQATGGFFRYLRWSVPSPGMSGAFNARFMIEGVGRKYA